MFVWEITVLKKLLLSALGEIAVEDVIPIQLAPKPTEDDSVRGEATAWQVQSEGLKEFWKKLI